MKTESMPKATLLVGTTAVDRQFEERLHLQFEAAKTSARAKRYKDVGKSKSIEIVYDSRRPGGLFPVPQIEHQELWRDLLSFRQLIRSLYGAGYVARCVVTQLQPGASIHPHVDPGLGFSIPHRIHWVVSTNPLTFFEIDGRRLHFAAGEVWEVDNKKVHSVWNDGETDRIHVIVDYVRAWDRADHECWNRHIGDDELMLMRYWFEREKRL